MKPWTPRQRAEWCDAASCIKPGCDACCSCCQGTGKDPERVAAIEKQIQEAVDVERARCAAFADEQAEHWRRAHREYGGLSERIAVAQSIADDIRSGAEP